MLYTSYLFALLTNLLAGSDSAEARGGEKRSAEGYSRLYALTGTAPSSTRPRETTGIRGIRHERMKGVFYIDVDSQTFSISVGQQGQGRNQRAVDPIRTISSSGDDGEGK